MYKTLLSSPSRLLCLSRTGERAFEIKVLRGIFEPKSNEVTGEWRRLHNEKLYYISLLTSTIRTIKSILIRLTGHVARVGKRHRTLLEGRRIHGSHGHR